MISAGTEPGRIIMEAAIEHRTTVHELTSQHIGAGIIQSNTLTKLINQSESTLEMNGVH